VLYKKNRRTTLININNKKSICAGNIQTYLNVQKLFKI